MATMAVVTMAVVTMAVVEKRSSASTSLAWKGWRGLKFVLFVASRFVT